ncbi:MAG: NUDIX domain-containing protein [Proteobacteria bacterium]|nr:NUDIX domain-containing protein [Pseudomonadota bacterium]MDA1309098.1 NUDIX domain-containing protein [Pseudomonadota bacterium]
MNNSLPHPKRPKVGVGVMLRRGEFVLLGKRLSGPGAGTYGWAGGHLEFGETPESCAIREVAEETGLMITEAMLAPLCVSNTMAYGSHYIDIEFYCEVPDGEPRVMEPDKLEAWAWHPIGALPEPMFEAAAMALQAMRRGVWWTAPGHLSASSVSG